MVITKSCTGLTTQHVLLLDMEWRVKPVSIQVLD